MGPSQHAIIVRGKERGEEVSCNKKKKNYVDIKKPKYTFNVFATCEDGFIDFGLRSLQAPLSLEVVFYRLNSKPLTLLVLSFFFPRILRCLWRFLFSLFLLSIYGAGL